MFRLKLLFAVCIFSVFFLQSCSEDSGPASHETIELSSDVRFINFAQDQVNALDKVKDYDAFEPFLNKTHLSNADITILSSLLGYDNKAQYESHLIKQTEIIKALDEQYDLSHYTEAQLTQFTLDALNTTETSYTVNSRNSKDLDPVETEKECRKRCRQEGVDCRLDAAIVAGIGHLECNLTHLFDPEAAFLCHALVDAKQIREIGRCTRAERDCKDACGNQ